MSLAIKVTTFIICPICGGIGEIGDYYWSDDEGCVVDDIRECPECKGKGEIREGETK